MIEATYLNQDATDRLFCAATGHVPVRLAQLTKPRLLWLNRRAMRYDPQFDAAGSESAHERHLLRNCALTLTADASAKVAGDTEVLAVADRYGGTGIGRNGGSGRAVFVNGYHVKGIGRTSLVSVLTDRAHASAWAYLEECVREAVLSEVVNAEFPFGAVPVPAIIETGVVQVWDTDYGPKPERQCLLVRPTFIRPAHFTRATDYISANQKEGALDANRVALTSCSAVDLFGAEDFSHSWGQFWLRWAEQLAYAYAHRLTHGGNTESNVALDERLLDFGAMTALPSLARVSTMQGGPSAGMDMLFQAQAMQAVAPFLGRHIDEALASPEALGVNLSRANDRYRQVLLREVLRVTGLTRMQSERLLQSALAARAVAAINRLVTHFAREQSTIFDGMPEPRISWDLGQFWQEPAPRHLHELRGLLTDAINGGLLGDGPAGLMSQAVAARCALRSSTREGLFRDRLKDDFCGALDGRYEGDRLTAAHVSRVIDDCVVRNRRSSLTEPDAALPIGFAGHAETAYALFSCQKSGSPFAVPEWPTDGTGQAWPTRLPIARLHDGLIGFASDDIAPARARVQRLDGWPEQQAA